MTVSPIPISCNPTFKRANGLTPAQHQAVDLVLTGATAFGTNDSTITLWRLYDPTFKVELVGRRRERWAGASESLRATIPLALDTLRDRPRGGPGRGNLALSILDKAGIIAAVKQSSLAALCSLPS